MVDVDQQGRIERLAQSMDFAAADMGSFQQVVVLLTAKQDWRALAQAYRVLSSKVEAHGEPMLAERDKEDVLDDLAIALSKVCLDRLTDVPGAIAALEPVIDRGSYYALKHFGTAWFDLASLYEEAGQLDRAVEQYVTAARVESTRAEIYLRLFDIHMHRGSLDSAWCAACVLASLGEVSGALAAFFGDYTPRRLRAISRPLDSDDWSLLTKPADPFISAVAQHLLRLVVPTVDLSPPQDGDLAWAIGALGGPAGSRGSFEPAAILATDAAAVRRRMTLASAVHEAALRREPWVEAAVRRYTKRQLEVLVCSASRALSPATPVPGDMADEVGALTIQLAALVPPAIWDQLRSHLGSVPHRVLVGSWRRAAKCTAARAALLLVGDIRLVGIALRETDDDIGRIDDLRAFMVSAAHVQLRERLGLSIGTGADAPVP